MSTFLPSWISRFASRDVIEAILLTLGILGGLSAGTKYILRKTQLSEPISFIVRGFFFHATQRVLKVAAARFSLRRYCTMQLSKPDLTYVFVPGAKDLSLKLDDIFVPLTLEQAGTVRTFDHTNIRSAGQRLQIVGDPGSGKSSFAKWIFRNECKTALANPTASRFPIFIELRNVSFKHFKATKLDNRTSPTDALLGTFILKYIRDSVRAHVAYEIDRCFVSYLTAPDNGLLVLLDGLDEVSSEDYPKAEAAINEFSKALDYFGAKNTIVLTMRAQFHTQVRDSYKDAFPTSFRLKPFANSDIYSFLDRWNFGDRSKIDQIARIYSELIDRPTLLELCTTPLILAMYVAHHQASDHEIPPESRTEFYERITDELLFRRRVRANSPPAGQKVVRELRSKVLGQIAYQHLIKSTYPVNVIPWEDAISAARTASPRKSRGACEELVREIAIETGLITEERERETCRFNHLTFCEFFAAIEATHIRRNGWKELFTRYKQLALSSNAAEKTRLSEVIPFASALVPIYERHGIVDQIAKIDDDRLLGLTFLETKAYDHPKWMAFIDKQRRELRHASVQDADWLRRLHFFILVCIDANRTARASRQRESELNIDDFVRELAPSFQNDILILIDEYARQDAIAAFRLASLCQIDILAKNAAFVVNNCLQPSFLAMVVERISTDVERRRRWSSALAEAGLKSLPVASTLHAIGNSPWNSLIAAIDMKDRWFIEPSIPRTAMTECITYCLNGEVVDPVFERLSALKSQVPIGRRTAANFFSKHLKMLMMGIWLVCLTLALAATLVEQIVWQELRPGLSDSEARLMNTALFLSFIPGIMLSGFLMMAHTYFDKYRRKFWIPLSEAGRSTIS